MPPKRANAAPYRGTHRKDRVCGSTRNLDREERAREESVTCAPPPNRTCGTSPGTRVARTFGREGRRFAMTRIEAVTVARTLLDAGLTLRDVAAFLRAHPRAVVALLRLG